MLHILSKKDRSGGVAEQIMSKRHSDGHIGPDLSKDKEEEVDSIEAAAEDMLKAFEEKDVKKLAAAVRAAFDILDSEPHEEGPHTNELLEGLK